MEVLGPCPALETHEGDSSCGLVAHPEKYAHPIALKRSDSATLSTAASFLIGSGKGCDAREVGEEDAPLNYQRHVRKSSKPKQWVRALRLLFLWIGGTK